MIIREVEKPRLLDIFKKTQGGSSDVLSEVQLVGSGKGALAIILEHLQQRGVLTSKLDEILVPDWLGYWVYNQIQPFAFPAKRFSEKTKALFVYHQYGFCQNMDAIMEFAREKNLVVIEDCAHAIDSEYKGKRVGTFGDFAVYSFSKWFFCFALGGVRAEDSGFRNYAEKKIKRTPFGFTCLKDIAKVAHEKSAFTENKVIQSYSNAFIEMTYALYGRALQSSRAARRLLAIKFDKEIKTRKKRYQYFLESVEKYGICEHLEKKGVTPYVIPVRVKNPQKLVSELRHNGVQSGVYNFDINRNLLSPQFVECVWIPCHSGMTDGEFEAVTKIVTRTLQGLSYK